MLKIFFATIFCLVSNINFCSEVFPQEIYLDLEDQEKLILYVLTQHPNYPPNRSMIKITQFTKTSKTTFNATLLGRWVGIHPHTQMHAIIPQQLQVKNISADTLSRHGISCQASNQAMEDFFINTQTCKETFHT